MRPILPAREYERVLRGLTQDQRQLAADAIVSAAREQMTKHGLLRAVFLCGEPLREIGELAAKELEANVFSSWNDLPFFSDALVCDLLFSSSMKNALYFSSSEGSTSGSSFTVNELLIFHLFAAVHDTQLPILLTQGAVLICAPRHNGRMLSPS